LCALVAVSTTVILMTIVTIAGCPYCAEILNFHGEVFNCPFCTRRL